MLRWAARRLLTHSKRAVLIEWCGPKPAPPHSARMSRSGAKGKCCSWAGLGSPGAPQRTAGRENGLLRAGSPALWPVSVLRLPPPASAAARPAASRPYWKRKHVARMVCGTALSSPLSDRPTTSLQHVTMHSTFWFTSLCLPRLLCRQQAEKCLKGQCPTCRFLLSLML